MSFGKLLEKMVQEEASDLFITSDAPPCIKKNKQLMRLSESTFAKHQTNDIVLGLMNEKQRLEFLESKECNFAIQVEKLGRFRVNAFQQRSKYGMVIRRIESHVPSIDELHLPGILKKLVMMKRGLIIVVGSTGAGKSTTLAAMIDHRNENANDHIVSIEDPIEYTHTHKKSLITQREVGIDTESFGIALKNTLRQAPDVILIGEIRTSQEMRYATTFAETGHLCLATLHANNANQALDRIASFFPEDLRDQLWMDLSLNLRAIIAQQLVPGLNNKECPCTEILINTPVISDYIKKGKIDALKDFMVRGEEDGMLTFDQSLFALYSAGKISYENALKHADSENDLRLKIKLQQTKTIKGHKDKPDFSIDDYEA